MQDSVSTSNSEISQDNIAVYQSAVQALSGREGETTPDVLDLKHKAVLALARAGATEQAQRDYERYGLTQIRHHEDIMALAGRLFKDRYSVSQNVEDARASASAYEAAFQDTGGYYSGINAATMSLLANVPSEIVMGRAQAVLSRLSDMTADNAQDRYFIQASRAEAHYILGDRVSAQNALQAALDYDPINYTAHASTYRQFQLLAKSHGEASDWFKPLRAPMAVHYAGHLFDSLTDEDRLKIAVSDIIQKEDIGFGYGALAAGSDIVFAEALLEEGGELHVILPVPVELFKAASVLGQASRAGSNKTGADWGARFEDCLKNASSLRFVTDQTRWPDPTLNNYAARIAMGEACMKASELSTQSAQLLLWDGRAGGSMTAQHATDWQKAEQTAALAREQFVLEFPESRHIARNQPDAAPAYEFTVMMSVNGHPAKRYKTVGSALAKLNALLGQAVSDEGYGLHIAPIEPAAKEDMAKASAIAQALSRDALPGSLLVSQDMAAILSLEHSANWRTGFTGWSESSGQRLPAFFAKFSPA